jgi:TIR domain
VRQYPEGVAAVSSIWQPPFQTGERFFRLFLSHTSQHRQEVGALSAALTPHGVVAFVAHDAIQPTEQWLDVIVRALHESEALAAYLTADFHDSAWTDQEVGAAIGRDLLVLPLKVGLDPYGFIGRYQAMNAANIEPPALAEQIAAVLRTHPRTKRAMAEAVIDRFVNSHSWNNARDNLKRLEQLPGDVWAPWLVDAVRQATSNNPEIQNADVGFGQSTVAAEALKLIESLPAATA